MDAYSRRRHFEYFRDMAYPYVGMTVELDITDFLDVLRDRGLPFFLSFYYCAVRAANAVPELRQRIRDGGIVEYDWCGGSHTVALEDGTYCYCVLDSRLPFARFLPQARAEQERAKRSNSLEDGEDSESLLFVSTLTGVSYTALVQPVPSPADSNPRITWGRYFRRGERTLLPLTLLCHHALVDGVHFQRYFEALKVELAAISG